MVTKERRKILIFALCGSMLMSGCFNISACGAETQNKETMSGGTLVKEKYEQMLQTEKEKEKKINKKGVKIANKISKKFGNQESTAKELDDRFGGIYLDEEQNPIVNMTETSEKVVEEVQAAAEEETVTINKVKYSLEELKEYDKLIGKFYEKNYKKSKGKLKELLQSIQGYAVNVTNNCVDVMIYQLDDEKSDTFKKYVTDAECIVLKNAEKKNELEAVNVKAGQAIWVVTTSGKIPPRYSLGCRVKWTTSSGKIKYGFITSAHGNAKGNYVYASSSLGSSALGPIVKRKYSRNVDVSVVRLDCSAAAYNVTNYLYGLSTTSRLSATKIQKLYEGMSIEKIGSTTGHSVGKLISCSTEFKYGDGFQDYVSYSNNSDGGDSGGIVYSYDATTSTLQVVGIHEGSDGAIRYGAKISNICSAFSTTLYLY